MKSVKKIIISFLVSLCIVILIQLIWNRFDTHEVSIYVAVKDIYKGENILKESIKEIKVQNNNEISKYVNVKIDDKIARETIVSGKVLESNDVTSKIDDIENENYEYLTIEVKDVSDSLAYQLKKGDDINVYYTTKNKKLDSILINRGETIETDLNITFRIFENIKVIGLYDSVGTEVSSGEQYKAIMIRVKAEDAMLISSIKAEGTFTVSTVK